MKFFLHVQAITTPNFLRKTVVYLVQLDQKISKFKILSGAIFFASFYSITNGPRVKNVHSLP